MLVRDLLTYVDVIPDDKEIIVSVYSIETGIEIAGSYAIAVDINEYGELMISIEVEI